MLSVEICGNAAAFWGFIFQTAAVWYRRLMMEQSHALDAKIEGEDQVQQIGDDPGVMQTTNLVVNGLSSTLQTVSQSDDVPEDALGRCNLECLQNSVECDSEKGLVLNNESKEMLIGDSSSSPGPNLVQDEGSKDLELDKNLPPIKTRPEGGQAREHSPSDLSPPSPKRLRQGSKESRDQWKGLWSPDGKV